MPIISRTVDIQPSGSTVFASFLAIDDKGLELRRSRSRFADEAAAILASDNHDWSPHLIRRELRDFEDHILDGNSAGSFVWVDQTQMQGFRRFLRLFASTEDLDRAALIAPTVLTFTKLQIQNNAGITDAQAQTVLDRANDLIAMALEQADAIAAKQDLEE